ncbi:MAG: PD40 domain-containing protein [Calditrichaeota bacterium]|nr:PD40 domain-containing protein [Calditrichota bacterium]
MNILLSLLLSLFLITTGYAQVPATGADQMVNQYPGEEFYLSNIVKISPEGEFRNGVLSSNGKLLFLQGSIPKQDVYEQVWMYKMGGGKTQMISAGLGSASNPVFFKLKNRVIFSSTMDLNPSKPMPMPMMPDLLWMLDDNDLYSVEIEGSSSSVSITETSSYNFATTVSPDGTIHQRLTETPGYDSEAAISPDGSAIVFSSFRKGDVDIYRMKIQNGKVERLTNSYGLDCHPCFSTDGQWIIFSSFIPETEEQRETYSRMLETKYVNMANFEIYVMRIDGSERRQLTDIGAVSINPRMHPTTNQIVFSSNCNLSVKGSDIYSLNFDIFVTNFEGSDVKQVTFNHEFDGYPSFDKAGSKIIWTSSRGTETFGQRSIYMADWKAEYLGKSTEE